MVFSVLSISDCNVILPADLQDPPELVPKMFDYWLKGIKFVVANRKDREESFGQKMFSNTYHYLIKKLALKNVPSGGCFSHSFSPLHQAIAYQIKSNHAIYQ